MFHVHLRRNSFLPISLFQVECFINIKFLSSDVSFKAFVSLLIFCLDDLSINECVVLKSPLLLCHCHCLFLWLLAFILYIEVLICWVYICLQLFFHLGLIPWSYVIPFFVPYTTTKSLQSCPTLCNPIDSSPPGSPSLGFSRQEHWSGLPFPSPMHEREKWKWSHSVVSDPQRPHGLQPSGLLHPWDFPGKSIGVGCHCLLLCPL